MSNYTPGPWRVSGLLIKAVDHGKWYGVAKAGGSKLTIEGNMANARLIAAAPELLEALKTLMNYVGGWDEPDTHPCGIAVNAIAKAEGKPDIPQATQLPGMWENADFLGGQTDC